MATDNDKMTANSWNRINTASIKNVRLKNNSRIELLNGIKEAVSTSLGILRGNAKSDTKYIKIIDLIMLRINSVLDNINIDDIVKDNVSDILDEINDRLAELTSGEILANITRNNTQSVSIKDITNEVCDILCKKIPSTLSLNNDNTSDISQSLQNTSKRENDTTTQTDNEQQNNILNQDTSYKEYNNVQDNINKTCCIVDKFFKYQIGQIYASDSFVQFIIDIDTRVLKFQLAGFDVFKTVNPIDIKLSNYYTINQLLDAVILQTNAITLQLKNISGDVKTITKKISKLTKGFRKYGIHIGYISMLDAFEFGGIYKKIKNNLFQTKKIFKQHLRLLKQARKVLKPKNIIERILDWVKEKIILHIFKTEFFKCMQEVPIFEYIKTRLRPILSNIFKKLFSHLISLARGIWQLFRLGFKLLRKTLSLVWRGLKFAFSKAMRGIITVLRTFLRVIYNIVKGLGQLLWNAIKSIWGFLKSKFGNFFKNIANKFKGFFKNLASKFKNITNGFQKVKGFFGKIGNFFKNFKNIFKNIVTKIKNIISGIKTKIINAVKTVIQKIVTAIKTVVKKVVEAIAKAVRTVVQKIAGFAKRKIIEIFKRIGINLAKKFAKKKAKGLGIKMLTKFFKKFFEKFIQKMATRMLAMVGINAVPGLGQIISFCMMIWTIVDTLLMVWDIYKMFKENPMLMDIAKEEVAKWIEKTFSFIKDLCDWGKKIFNSILRFYKGLYHAAGDFFFASNREMNKVYEDNLNAIEAEYRKVKRQILAMKKISYTEYCYQNLQNPKIEQLLTNIDKINKQIFQEDESWWRDTDQMTQWMHERQPLYLELINLLAHGGLFQLTGFFDQDFIGYVRDEIQLAKKRFKAQLDAEARKAELARFAGMRLDFQAVLKTLASLEKAVKDRKEKIQKMQSSIKSEYTKAKVRLDDLFPDMFDNDEFDMDDNSDTDFDAA